MSTDLRFTRLCCQVLLAFSAFALTLSGCTTAPRSPSGSSAAPVDATLQAKLPAQIRNSGLLRVATDASYPPMEFFGPDRRTIVGIDPDLGQAMGEVLGLQVEFVNTSFDGIIAGLQSQRFDLAMSAITDKPARREQVDFVDYLQVGSALLVAAGNPKQITQLGELCGLKLAVEQGTSAADTAQDEAAQCISQGRAPLAVLSFPDQNGANMALQSGRADVVMANLPTLAYLVQQAPGQFELAGQAFGVAPYGIAVAKNEPALRDAVRGALVKLIETGRYGQLLAKWNLAEAAVTEVTVNGARA